MLAGVEDLLAGRESTDDDRKAARGVAQDDPGFQGIPEGGDESIVFVPSEDRLRVIPRSFPLGRTSADLLAKLSSDHFRLDLS